MLSKSPANLPAKILGFDFDHHGSQAMDLRLDPSLPPTLYDLGEYKFQRFCLELFQQEPEISIANEYGTRGQAQYGIDLRADRKDGMGIEVGQCK